MNRQPKRVFQPIAPEVEKVGKSVLDAAFKVHTTLGPGLLESVYETTTAYELRKGGLIAATQISVPIVYDDQELDSGFRLDMLVEKCVIVEIKSVETMHPVYEAQIMTYLRLSKVRLGFLINFNVKHLKDGIKRFVV
jgi:GxxExxY protein